MYSTRMKSTYSLFLGGMGQYYYDNEMLTKDDKVPFVKTISLVERDSNNVLKEYVLKAEMPALIGASSEFALNREIPHNKQEMPLLDSIQTDSIILGHIVGGIYSPSLNPFSQNQTSQTAAVAKIYEVVLHRKTGSFIPIKTPLQQSFSVSLLDWNSDNKLSINLFLPQQKPLKYMLSNQRGQVVQKGSIYGLNQGESTYHIESNHTAGLYYLTLIN